MIKYILNSGHEFKNSTKAKIYVDEIFKESKNEPTLLIVNFAQRRKDWEDKYQEKVDLINAMLPGHVDSVHYNLAYPKNLEQQILDADIIYIHGGEDVLLKHYFDKVSDLSSLLENKVIVGSSAGSCFFTSSFWSSDWRSCRQGSGTIRIKFIPHYKSERGLDSIRGLINWDKAYKELESYGDPSLPIYAPEEGDFVVIEQ